MADHEVHGHGSADDEYLSSADATYERTDARIGPVAKFMLWLGVLTILTFVGVGVMFSTMVNNRVETDEPRYPLAGVTSGLPPEPAGVQLQIEPQLDLERFRGSEEARLETYGWVDEESGIVRLPIEEAMRLTLERGLPASDASAAPEMRPSDSSAGRVDGGGTR
jgi:hypothetical protein